MKLGMASSVASACIVLARLDSIVIRVKMTLQMINMQNIRRFRDSSTFEVSIPVVALWSASSSSLSAATVTEGWLEMPCVVWGLSVDVVGGAIWALGYPSQLWSNLHLINHVPIKLRVLDRHVPLSMPRLAKLVRAAESLSSRWLVTSIWPRALCLFDRRYGFFTAVICLFSVIDEYSPFGAPKSRISSG